MCESNLGAMYTNDSLNCWLNDLRFTIDYYERFDNLVFDCQPSTNLGGMEVIANRFSGDYVNIWDCTGNHDDVLIIDGDIRLRLKFATISRISFEFCDTLEQLDVLPVIVQQSKLDISEDVKFWMDQIRFSCDEEPSEILEFQDFLNQTPTHKKDPPFPSRDHTDAGPRPKTFTTPTISRELQEIQIDKDDTWKYTAKSLVIIKANKQEILVGLVKAISKEGSQDVIIETFSGMKHKLQFTSQKKLKQFQDELPNSTDTQKKSLLNFFKRRVSKEYLEDKGIIKDEPVFGNSLKILYEMNNDVPKFMLAIIKILEEEPNIKSQGLYRQSGNLASIQTIRLKVDENKLEILEQSRKDIDVLTGALKLFFRELKEPLIPTDVVDEIWKIIDKSDCEDTFRPILQKKMQIAHRHTLYVLLKHLIYVLKFAEFNKMDAYNLSVCWAQAVIFMTDTHCQDLVTKFAEAVKVFEFILKYYNENQDALRFLKVESNTIKKSLSQDSHIDKGSLDVILTIICYIEKNINEDGIYLKTGNLTKSEKILKNFKKLKTKNLKTDSCIDIANAFKKFLKEMKLVPEEVIHEFNDKRNIISKGDLLNLLPKRDVIEIVLSHMERVMDQKKDMDQDKFIDLMGKNFVDNPEVNCSPLIKFLMGQKQPDLLNDLKNNKSYKIKQEERAKSIYDNIDTPL